MRALGFYSMPPICANIYVGQIVVSPSPRDHSLNVRRGFLLRQPFPNSQRFQDAPGLRVAAARLVRRVAVKNFRKLAQAVSQ